MYRYVFYLILVFVCFLAACSHDDTPYGDNQATGRFYRIRGMEMYCEVYGQGKPLLMIHGNGGSISTFSRNIGYFAKKYQVIVADSRSHGHSADLRDSISFEQIADDYADLLDSLHAGPAHILGWSDGGIVALLMAMRHPQKVDKLVASGANLWPDTTAVKPAEWTEEQKEYLKMKTVQHMTIGQKNRWKLLLLDMEQPHISLNQLHSIKCPAFIVCGENDLIRREHTQLIYNNLLHANLWVIPHEDHYTISEHVRDFNRRMDEFFTKPFHE